MKAWLKSLLPRAVVRAYHRRRRAREDRHNANRSAAEVFSEIYKKGTWGQSTGPYCSGHGSATDAIVGPYVRTIKECLRSHGPGEPRVVDLGCGDFSVGRQLVEDCAAYVGVDVVPDLVRHLEASVRDPRVRFLCLDIVREELPSGDICLIRQVLQHLSNDQIGKVLARLGRYPTVFVTEHYPSDGPAVVPNLDKVHGSGIRLYENSGVYLDRPPFNVPKANLELLLELPGHGFDGLYDPGVIRTFRYVVNA
jgi:SAM-dependent methyltransferase